jgi:hypothetical protein
MSACAATLDRVQALAGRTRARPSPSAVKRMMADAVQFGQNALELLHWVCPPRVLSAQEANRRAEAFRELGDDWVKSMASGLQKLPEGKPARMRQSHIAAFEFMLQSKKNSLRQAVKKFCPCGGQHSEKCAERFKVGVRALKKIIRKHAPSLVSRYDSLHPNRNVRFS